MTTALAITAEMLIMIGLPIVAATVICRRWRVSPAIPLIAAGFFLAQLVLNSVITKWLLPSALGQGVVTILLSAVTYGVFEETARYLSFRVGPLRRRRDTGGALAAGIGHGGMESITFAAPYLINAVLMAFVPSLFPASAISTMMHTNPMLYIGTGLDRIPAMLTHIVFAIMIVLAYRTGRRAWFFAAMFAHAAVDAQMFILTAYAPTAVWVFVWAVIAALALAIVVTVVRRGVLDDRPGVVDRTADTPVSSVTP